MSSDRPVLALSTTHERARTPRWAITVAPGHHAGACTMLPTTINPTTATPTPTTAALR